jgi:hypothetical protein
MTKRTSKITFRGRRSNGEFEFNETTFLRIQKDLQTGKTKAIGGRVFVIDGEMVGLRALVGKREISYHVQFSVRDKKTGEVGARSTMVIGSYPEDSIEVARGRARVARDAADNGEDPRERLRPTMFKHLDELRQVSDKRAKAVSVLDKLAEAGVDLDALTARLEKEFKRR